MEITNHFQLPSVSTFIICLGDTGNIRRHRIPYIREGQRRRSLSTDVAQARVQWLFTGTILLLISTRVLTCLFLPWTNSSLLLQPGSPSLLGDHHIDGEVSVGSTSWVQALLLPQPAEKRGLQARLAPQFLITT